MTPEQLENWFSFHPPADEMTIESYKQIRNAGRLFAEIVVKHTPPSADQTTAVRKIREAVMTANAAIACGGK